jgi:hypothetical protein
VAVAAGFTVGPALRIGEFSLLPLDERPGLASLYAPERIRAREGDQGVIKICRTVLSGAAAGRIREQTEGLAPGQLRELAVQLAADPDLTVSVITNDNGRAELEVPHTGPPRRTEHTTDCCWFERDPALAPARTMSVATPASLIDAAEMIRAILRTAQHTAG